MLIRGEAAFLSHRPTERPIHLSYSRRGHEFLSHPQLGIFRKENLGNKDLVWRQLARGNTLIVFDVLLRIDRDDAGLVGDGVVVGPFGQQSALGIHQVNLDPLIGWKIQGNSLLCITDQHRLDLKLANLGQLYRLRRDLQFQAKTAQFRILVGRRSRP